MLFKQHKNTFIKIKKLNVIINRKISLQWFIKINKKNLLKIKDKYNFNVNLYKIILTSLLLKDCLLLLNWLKETIEKLNLKYHRSFFSLLFLLFQVCRNFFLKYYNIFGLRIIIKGKIGSIGGNKTKTISFYQGRNSLNNKKLKVEYQKIQIKTKSGTLGIKYFLFF